MLGANNVVIGNPPNYWGEIGGANRFQLGTAGGPDFDTQTNLLSVQFLMGTAKNLDLTVDDNLAEFLCTFFISYQTFHPYSSLPSRRFTSCRWM